jgi:hypothetical protein
VPPSHRVFSLDTEFKIGSPFLEHLARLC